MLLIRKPFNIQQNNSRFHKNNPKLRWERQQIPSLPPYSDTERYGIKKLLPFLNMRHLFSLSEKRKNLTFTRYFHFLPDRIKKQTDFPLY